MIGTRQAAKLLGVRPGTLTRAVWEGRIQSPTKGPGNAFVWSDDDLRRASWVLLRRDYKAEPLQDREGAGQGGAR
jgi:hypothetical protein